MKYGLIKYGPLSFNLGDEIQSLAARRFLPRVDAYVDREYLDRPVLREEMKVIMNGWFKFLPSHWPPAENIIPFFVSFHAAPHAADSLLGRGYALLDRLGRPLRCRRKVRNVADPVFADYYRRHGPIGCRDLFTAALLKDQGIPAEFTGCLSLTLERPSPGKREGVVFVDPFGGFPPWNYRQDLWGRVPKKIRRDSLKLSHVCLSTDYGERFAAAEKLLDVYARARLVVTARLHCALPCLAFRTPVILIINRKNDVRMGGLAGLTNHFFLADALSGGLDIDWEHPPANPAGYVPLKEDLEKRCRTFIEEAR